MSLSQSATSQCGWGRQILRGGIDPADLRFRRRVVEVIDLWKTFQFGDGNLSSPGCVGCMYDSKAAIGWWRWGFYTVRGGFDTGDHRFRSQNVEVVAQWREF